MTVAATTIPDRTPANPPWQRVRRHLGTAMSRGVKMASAARHRYRRPALVISGFGCIDAAAWHSYGIGAGLLVLGALLLVWEFLGAPDEQSAQ